MNDIKNEWEHPWETPIALKLDADINVNNPLHYQSEKMECIDAIEAQLSPEEFMGFLKGNIAKYLWREKTKGGAESLRKAKWYLDKLIQIR